MSAAVPPTMSALIMELLAWVAAQPRTYGETMEAWRTSCPRTPVWEDATSDGLVEVVRGDRPGLEASTVKLTPLGAGVLAAATGTAEHAVRKDDRRLAVRG